MHRSCKLTQVAILVPAPQSDPSSESGSSVDFPGMADAQHGAQPPSPRRTRASPSAGNDPLSASRRRAPGAGQASRSPPPSLVFRGAPLEPCYHSRRRNRGVSRNEVLKQIAVGVVVGVAVGLLMGLLGSSLHLSPGVRGGVIGAVVVVVLGALRRRSRVI